LIPLARLAVDRRFAGKGLGHALISEAFRIGLGAAVDRALSKDADR
jgi:predicted N-acetyltransferase YhbS